MVPQIRMAIRTSQTYRKFLSSSRSLSGSTECSVLLLRTWQHEKWSLFRYNCICKQFALKFKNRFYLWCQFNASESELGFSRRWLNQNSLVKEQVIATYTPTFDWYIFVLLKAYQFEFQKYVERCRKKVAQDLKPFARNQHVYHGLVGVIIQTFHPAPRTRSDCLRLSRCLSQHTLVQSHTYNYRWNIKYIHNSRTHMRSVNGWLEVNHRKNYPNTCL